MKLYLKAQVVEAAIAKHGSLEELEEMRRERMQACTAWRGACAGCC